MLNTIFSNFFYKIYYNEIRFKMHYNVYCPFNSCK